MASSPLEGPLGINAGAATARVVSLGIAVVVGREPGLPEDIVNALAFERIR